jgi:tripartite-type tricarboxylate transporter receptor subunit TctC
MRFIATFAALAAACLFSSAASAQAFPSKTVHFLVAFAPGGGTDIIARVVAERLTQVWGQAVVVENKPGAGSNIGTRFVAQSPADGYTILVTSTSFAVNPTLYASPGYDPIKDFVPIINGGYSPTIIFANPSVPADKLQALIALGKKEKLSYATAGVGTVSHLTAENVLNNMAKMDITHIAYSGAGPAFQAVVGGHVPVGALAFATPGLYDWLKSGKLKPIAISSNGRFAGLPDVPTIAESGFPGYSDVTWIGFFAPAGTPKEIVTRINEAIGRIMQTPEVRERLTKIGFDWAPNTAAQFDAFVKEDVIKWGKVVKATGTRAE